jgi:two-component system LytT family response regulator
MSCLRVLIVDDSRLARGELRTLLAAHPQVEVVGEADDVDSAVSACGELGPDLLLLDIQLPQGSGFDVLERLLTPPPVVFCSAYDEYALRAFERNALDYLLKPVEPQRLRRALQKVQDARRESAPARELLGADDPVFLRDGERCWFVNAGEISHVEMDGNYATVHFRGQQVLLTRSLASLEARLDPTLFFRASRSVLVNLRQVSRVAPAVGEGYTLTLKSGAEVDVSRRQARAFRERLAL